jgi:hypothetical protein
VAINPSDLIVVDPLDPLLEHFALQFDLRERFVHALEQILKIDLAAVACTHDDAAEQMVAIAKEAIDDATIAEWVKNKRPMPWLDDAVNPLAEQVRREVMEMLGL